MARRKKSFSLSDWDYAPFHAAALQKMKPRKLVDALNAIVPFEQQPGVQEQLQLVIDRAETLRDIAEAAYRLGLAQQAGESARLREGLEAIEALLTEELRERFGQAEHTRSSRRMFCLLVIPRNIARNALQAAAAPSGAAEPTHGHTKGTD
jgi:hypothetical protein